MSVVTITPSQLRRIIREEYMRVTGQHLHEKDEGFMKRAGKAVGKAAKDFFKTDDEMRAEQQAKLSPEDRKMAAAVKKAIEQKGLSIDDDEFPSLGVDGRKLSASQVTKYAKMARLLESRRRAARRLR